MKTSRLFSPLTGLLMARTNVTGVVLAALLLALPLRADSAVPSSDLQSLRIIKSTPAVFPESLIREHRNGGSARIAIEVDEQGRLTDLLVVGYTHRLFADSAVAALRTWRFEPARLRGKPVPVCATFSFNFEVRGVVISLLASETVDALFFGFGTREIYAPCPLRSLDRGLVPVATVAPRCPKDLGGSDAMGEVLVKFFVDESGAVRLPHIVGQPSPELAALAVEALQQWRFQPPTRNGRPVLVSAQQPFRFNTTVADAR